VRRFVHPLIFAALFATAAIGQSDPKPRPAVAVATPTTISVIDLSGAQAHAVIVLIDGQPYNAVARPVIDPPSPMPGPTPTPGPLPPPAPGPEPTPTPTPQPPVPVPTPAVTPIDMATHIWVTYVSASTTTDQDVLTVANDQTIDASLKSSLNAEWTSLDVLNDAKALETRKLTTYVNGSGVPCLVVQDDQGNVYDKDGRKVVPSDTVKAHAIPGPTSVQGVIDLITKLRGK
jgi:hypothetical protein